jgi:hypothetical protein
MPPVDLHLLGTKTAAIADRRHGVSDRPQRRHREIGRLDDGVDVTRRLFDSDSVGLGFGKPQPAGDFAHNLLLTFAVHRLTFDHREASSTFLADILQMGHLSALLEDGGSAFTQQFGLQAVRSTCGDPDLGVKGCGFPSHSP